MSWGFVSEGMTGNRKGGLLIKAVSSQWNNSGFWHGSRFFSPITVTFKVLKSSPAQIISLIVTGSQSTVHSLFTPTGKLVPILSRLSCKNSCISVNLQKLRHSLYTCAEFVYKVWEKHRQDELPCGCMSERWSQTRIMGLQPYRP